MSDADPLSAMLVSSSSSSSSSSYTADAWKKAATAGDDGGSTEILSSVDLSKVKLKKAKMKEVTSMVEATSSADPSTVDHKDRFGLGVDLFGDQSKSTVKRGDLFDEIKTEVDSDNIFVQARQDAAEAAKNDILQGMQSKIDVNSSKREIRVTHEAEDDKLNDLKVTGLLQEEELDFDMFGTATDKLRKGHEARMELKKGTVSITSVKTDDFEGVGSTLTDEYLASMNQATSGKDLSKRQIASGITNTGYTQPTNATKASADAAAALDLNSLDLNSYISQQSETSKGGLFD